MTILCIRTIIIYSLVVFALRIMGKRQVGELQPSELVVAIMISDLATMPMSDVSIPLVYGIVPIFTLVICEVALSFVGLKSERVRVFLSGSPQILVRNGKIQQKELLHSRVNIDDLAEELRKEGYFSFSDVDTVVLETGGSISVIPAKEAALPTNKDLGIEAIQEKIAYILIADGKIRQSELKQSGRDLNWVMQKIKENGMNSVEDVFILTEDGEKNVYIQRKDKKA